MSLDGRPPDAIDRFIALEGQPLCGTTIRTIDEYPR